MNRPNPRGRQERVYTLDAIEVRAADGEEPKITGHAAVFNRWSLDLGGFKERILPGAFTKTLAASDVRALFNHNPDYILGRNTSGTLTLAEDRKGLAVEISPPDTQTIRDLVLEPMRRGDVNQMSFAFTVAPDGDQWREPKKAGQLWERDITEVNGLYDVSPVVFPAYPQTDAALRSLLDQAGIDFSALTALITRSERGLSLTDSDIDLVNGSIAVLRSYLPVEADEASGQTPDEGARANGAADDAEATQPAGPTVGHLRRLLEFAEAA